MSKLKVENFGPITTGYAEEGGFMDFRKVTVFIGSQGSGKSSVAKLFTTMSWLEKALFQGRVTEKFVTGYNRFVRRYCAYMNVENYFRDDTYIEYRGLAATLIYQHKKLSVDLQVNTPGYRIPKIMYVPAERNFLSAVHEPDKLKGLPSALLEYWEELRQAQREVGNDGWQLPIGNVRFEYDKSNRIPWLISKAAGKVPFRLRLAEASSGFQSLVPLLLVSRYLTQFIYKEQDASRSEMSADERRRLREQVDIILKSKLPLVVQQEALESLTVRFRPTTFLNVVEEPEQNLFPTSQRAVLYALLDYANTLPTNELVITTHSPYILNYLTLAIQADEVKQTIQAVTDPSLLEQRLKAIVPLTATLAADQAVVYALTSAGAITRLPMDGGIPSDDNDLNNALGEANASFADLMEIELATDNA